MSLCFVSGAVRAPETGPTARHPTHPHPPPPSYPCIIMTAKGQPDVASRLFLRKLRDTLRIPVLALVDSDPYGLKILSVYMKGARGRGVGGDCVGIGGGKEGVQPRPHPRHPTPTPPTHPRSTPIP